ncbi:ABC transporter permease [Winogradskyella sp.]|uniref:ABC transporter permease n=1 Tax=Winogradskyella sp. TaxID=1883156 RepID=UPI00262BBB4A|nr:ABC transporter permease [Winogradskyella sp.]
MFKNYLKIAWRNITKNKMFFLINVTGLTIGLSASFVIGLIIYYDATFDNFHPDKEKIYRVVSDLTHPKGGFSSSGVTLALKDAIKENPNFEVLANFFIHQPIKVENPEKNTEFSLPSHVVFADQAYFELFQYTFLARNSENPIVQPNSVVLSENRAKQYFPNESMSEIIGKTLVYNDSINTKVTGIVEKLPGRTDFIFEEFISWPTLLQTSIAEKIKQKNWGNTSSASQLFVKVIPNVNLDNIQKQLDQLEKENQDPESIKYGYTRRFKLQPLNDIHLNRKYGGYNLAARQVNKSLLWSLGFVALFLLLLGCVNFINLNTAQATERAKEIGVRKTFGSSKKQLVAQFLGETFLLVLISAVLSFALIKWLLEVFSDFVPQGLEFEMVASPWVIIGMVFLLIAVTFLSGFYPALVLSKYKPIIVLKNNLNFGDKKTNFRKTLIVFQFTIAQIFIIATLVIGKQINYLLTKEMGFKTDAVVSVYAPISARQFSKLELFANKLKSISDIDEVTVASSPPASFSSNIANITRMVDSMETHKDIYVLHGDASYTNVFDINILAGTRRKNNTIQELVLNETAVKEFGFKSPQDAIGEMLDYNGEPIPIVGVMQDFHQSSLRVGIPPMALIGDWTRSMLQNFKLVSMSIFPDENTGLSNAITKIEKAYNEVYPGTEMRLQFMDETVESFYKREQRTSKLLKWATGLSILISCLGLFGLVMYTTNRRVKEIGIRKVLGATVIQINSLICKDFIKLVGLAFLVATPIAYYGAYKWLQGFAFNTGISWWIFLLSGAAMLILALLVVSARTLQAAKSNPVKSLRTE